MQEPFTKEQELDLSIFETEETYQDIKKTQDQFTNKLQGTATLYQQSANPYSNYYHKPRFRPKQDGDKINEKTEPKKIRYREKSPVHQQENIKVEKEIKQLPLQYQTSDAPNSQVITKIKDKQESPELSSPESQISNDIQKNQTRSPQEIENNSNQIEEIPVIELLSNEQRNGKKNRKSKKSKTKEIIAFNISQDQSLLQQSYLSRKNPHFSFTLEDFNLVKQLQEEDHIEKYKKMDFHHLFLTLLLRGPIKTIKIKGIIVSFFSPQQIKIEKQENQEYSCQQKYQDLIQIVDNVYQYRGRRDYQVEQKEVTLELCHMKIPKELINQVYTRENLYSAPIVISKISVVCFCSRKSEFVLSSEGGTCKNCSLPFQLSIQSLALN